MSKNITEAICAVMAEVGAIEKRGRNDFHRYNYATAADLAHKLQPLLAKHGLIVIQTEVERHLIDKDNVMAVDYDFSLVHKSGEVWPERPRFTGLAAARNTKGGFDDKCINKCHTAARKYFLLGLFQIPTGDYDDADAQEDVPAQSAAPAANGKKREPRQIEPPPSKEEKEGLTRAKALAEALKAATDAQMLNNIWAHADVDGLPDKHVQRLRAIYYERVNEMQGDDEQPEPEEARFLRAG